MMMLLLLLLCQYRSFSDLGILFLTTIVLLLVVYKFCFNFLILLLLFLFFLHIQFLFSFLPFYTKTSCMYVFAHVCMYACKYESISEVQFSPSLSFIIYTYLYIYMWSSMNDTASGDKVCM